MIVRLLGSLALSAMLVVPSLVAAQTAPSLPSILVTPDTVDTRVGKLEFRDGAELANRREGFRHPGLHSRP